jgi:thioredoxin reductase (NADPH)
MLTEDIVEMDLASDIKTLKDGYGNAYSARTVILAMGSGYRKLGLEGEDRLSGTVSHGVPPVTGFFFRDKEIAVIGGGDSAVEEATFLTRFAKSVTIVHRRDELRASKIMADRAFNNPKIKFAWNSLVTAIHGDKKVEAITLKTRSPVAERELPISGLFIAIGHEPRSDLVKGQGGSGSRRLCDHRRQDHRNQSVRSLRLRGTWLIIGIGRPVTAAGTGCAAALDAERYLAALHHGELAAAAAEDPAILTGAAG